MKEQRKDQDHRKDETSDQPAEKYNATDPEEKMEGPVSSSMKKIGGSFDTGESKEHADKKRDKNM